MSVRFTFPQIISEQKHAVQAEDGLATETERKQIGVSEPKVDLFSCYTDTQNVRSCNRGT